MLSLRRGKVVVWLKLFLMSMWPMALRKLEEVLVTRRLKLEESKEKSLILTVG